MFARLSKDLLRTLIVFLLVAWPCLSSPAQQKNEDKIWVVNFLIGYAGHCKGYIARDKLCFANGVTRFLFLPPNYDEVYLVADEPKVVLKEKLDKWLLHNAHLQWAPWITTRSKSLDKNGAQWTSPSELKCETYECVRPEGEGVAYFAATRTMPANEGVCKAACKFVGAPLDKGLPIVFMPRLDRNSWTLSTTKAQMIVAPKDIFSVPKNYRQAKDEADLYVGGDMDLLFLSPPKKK
jgi:hypothetical protein